MPVASMCTVEQRALLFSGKVWGQLAYMNIDNFKIHFLLPYHYKNIGKTLGLNIHALLVSLCLLIVIPSPM